MIKLIALVTMLIDHVGAAFFGYEGLRVIRIFARCIGRFSMPLFAYCIARSFDHYSKNGNLKKYFRNLAILGVVSQYPFWIFCQIGVERKINFDFFDFFNFGKDGIFGDLNICFTWILSVLLLWAFSKLTFELNKKNVFYFCLLVGVILCSIFIPVDYGIYGVLFVVGFYLFSFKIDSPILLLLFSIFNYFVFCWEYMKCFVGSDYQCILGLFAVFFAVYLQKSKLDFRIPKGIFYFFYPIHLVVLALVQYGFLHKIF